jgi:prepilin-type N-terminal cleavage/methylation domain-containing protein
MTDRQRRGGFTLLELLIVLLIIGLLVAITAAAVGRYFIVSQNMVTETTIRKVYARLMAQWASVIDSAKNEDMNAVFSSSTMNAITSMTGGDPSFTRVIYIKLRLAQEFPISMAEVYSPPAGMPGKVSYQRLPNPIPTVNGYNIESSALLLASIREARHGLATAPDDFGSSVKTVMVGTTPVDYLVDGWGTPLNFYRWPTGSTELDALCPAGSTLSNTASTIVRDPQDPDGRLFGLWTNPTNRALFESWCHSLHQGSGVSITPYAYYTFPTIVSAGPDLQFGLSTTPPAGIGTLDMSTISGTTYDGDNIYSFRLVPPGAKGS